MDSSPFSYTNKNDTLAQMTFNPIVFNTIIFELYNSEKINRDTYSKPPWALRVPMKAEDRYPYVLFSLISRAQILRLLFQMRQHII